MTELCLGADTISRSESHETRLEKLSALLARKASVEASIMAHTRAMEKAYVETIKEVTVIIAGRTQDLVAEPAVSSYLLLFSAMWLIWLCSDEA